MEQGNQSNNNIQNTNSPSTLFNNIDTITVNTGYQIRTNENNNLRLEENERINDKNNIVNGLRYHLTRNQGSLTVSEDSSIQIEQPNVFNLLYAVRSQGNQFTLTRTPNLVDYIFVSNNLRLGAVFNVLGSERSRCVSVVNFSGKLIKIGILHVTSQRTNGLINRNYIFQLIINNGFRQPITVNFPGGGRTRTVVQDIENLNLFIDEGDTLGLNYNGSGGDGGGNATGNYCEVRLTLDTNARRNNFGGSLIP